MKTNPKRNRAGAAVLSALLLTGLVTPASAAVRPVLDESYYGTLDYYGGLREGSVVKSYRTNGNQVISDTGSYDEVVNLTDRTEPSVSGDKVTFDLGEHAPENFYFEGKTTKPYDTMPFTIQLSYRMNGVDTEPEDMAGQTGVGEVQLDILPSQNASEYERNNFVLMAMTVFKDRDILSLEAPGAQVQKMGDMDAVLYMVLPGEEQHFTLRIGSEDFSFNGFTFLVEPATLSQLDQITDLREAKEDVEDSYNSITASINTILNSLDGLDNKLVSTANGLDQLNRGRGTLSAGKGRVYDEADKTLASMTNLSQSLSPVVSHLQTGKDALAETTEQMTILSDRIDSLRPEAKDLKKSLHAVRDDLNALNDLLNSTKNDTKKLSKLLTNLDGDLDQLQSDLKDVQSSTKDLSGAMDTLSKTQIGDLEEMKIQGHTTKEIREYHKNAEAIHDYLKLASREDKDNEGIFVSFVLQNHSEIAKAIAGTAEGDAFAAYDAMLSNETTVKTLAYLYYNWDAIEPKVQEAETFNSMLGDANGSIGKINAAIHAIAKPTAKLLDNLAALTGNVNDDLLNDSRDLLTTLQSILDSAGSYDNDSLHSNLDAILQTSENLLDRTDAVLEQSKALSDTVTKYEPDAQKALDDAITQVNASVALLDDLNAFTRTFEKLMKAADSDLDQGAEKSLTGLSGSLRQMASGLGATDTVRTANNDVQNLVEDKWNEYTGEKNNMLNMDSQAAMVSLTSDQNQTPNSVQLILRSQEIKVDEAAQEAEEAASQPKTTVWDRIVRMFKDFGAIFTGD